MWFYKSYMEFVGKLTKLKIQDERINWEENADDI